MRIPAIALLLLASACGGGSSDKKDAALPRDTEGPTADATPLIGCTPVSGTTVKVRPIGQVSGSAVLATAPKNDGRLFVIEQQGRIRVFENEMLKTEAFLDINSIVTGGTPPNEQGLLGLAFHPNYAVNRQFYVFYTTSNANIVARYFVSAADPNKADPAGEVILSIPDFAGNHNGGMIEFGPDGYLYIGTGDGGSADDPRRNGQALDRANCTVTGCEPWLGKILRIDVDTTAGTKKYGIPSDNPFATSGGEPEIYVIGLRNPWRWSFDRMTGDLWIGDVGQNLYEEMTVLKAGAIAGKNLGWSKYEANTCFKTNHTPCSAAEVNTGNFVGPQYVKNQTAGWRSVIGGEVYRGSCFPDLVGYYFMTDYAAAPLVRGKLEINGSLTAIDLPTPSGWPTTNNGGQPISIHGDARGELFVTTTTGRIFQIEAGP